MARAAAVTAVLAAGAVAMVVADAAAQAPMPTRALSFDVGEERRYRIGPKESLGVGESAEWTLALRSIVDENGEYVANFEFTHERFESIPGSFDPAAGFMIVNVTGRLRTNLAGFPLWLEYTQEFDGDDGEWSDSGQRLFRYVYEGEGKYRKFIKAGRNDWDFKVPIPKYKHMDFEGPQGLYMYLPTALECVGTSRGTCIESEPAFANPGFLSMLAAALEEVEEGKRDFMFFMPGGLAQSPFMPLTSGSWLSRERDQIGSARRYFDTVKLTLGTSWDIDVGPKNLHAWEVELCCGIKHVYIEPGGRVLRVNLDTTVTNPDERYIRLVFPFEEFLSNEDPVLR
ncbi:MAG: hypothetical protein GKS06_03650 [Acidobacteria bacterium]|nr:hypothetical protein [Acidobacteriota bacterium]